MAASALAEWDRPVTVAFTEKAKDWQDRQKIQYAAILGLLKQDFLGLRDWGDLIGRYSKANPMQLSGPMAAIQPDLTLNKLLLPKLVDQPGLGQVGTYLLQVLGFAAIVLHPEEILNTEALDGALEI